MTVVYILIKFWFEGEENIAVVTDENVAKNWTKEKIVEYQKTAYGGKYSIEELPHGFKVGDEGFYYEKFILNKI